MFAWKIFQILFLANHVHALRLQKFGEYATDVTGTTPAELSAQTFQEDQVHMYVINLDRRKDRCACMANQTASLPWPVFRQAAATEQNVLEVCPEMSSHESNGKILRPSQMALFCSNYQIYKYAQRRPDKAPFFIILEDDVKIDPEFQKKTDAFLNSACAKNTEWDMIAVDTFGGYRGGETQQCFGEATDGRIASKGGQGSHFVIYRSASIDKFLSFKGHATDHYKEMGAKVMYWHPQITTQASVSKTKIAGCDRKVGISNVWPQSVIDHNNKGQIAFPRTQQKMKCPE